MIVLSNGSSQWLNESANSRGDNGHPVEYLFVTEMVLILIHFFTTDVVGKL